MQVEKRIKIRLVKPGGVLIYSTCSIDPEENEERIEAFLLRHPKDQVVANVEARIAAWTFLPEEWGILKSYNIHLIA
ncbi:hypothetical protein A4A49_21515 [Nicotiana attenuata]|uniref:SAM-dependent MTase RsmB/NOP-type domain-containing protein n=1 Tax=Nicotiana attenuata TaxID=49451 RepID=A0A1J6L318_NICAT|nr:hypothetical protein A4A49_21515 [Nicotiana attenuata]